MNVLSLFDGMSCGQIALRELGITPRRYYASEIDKPAIGQTQLNFPETIQLGDVNNWRNWSIEWANIDLLLAGSPCQGFSFAGKQLAFDDPRSALFFVFVEILSHCRAHNPKIIFLLENVEMRKPHLRVITDYCGIYPVHINSARVSAQNRKRVYWSNLRTREEGLFGELHTDIPQPADRGIYLRDILQSDVPEKYYLKASVVEKLLGKGKRISPENKKAKCITGASGHGAGYHSDMDLICVAMRGRGKENPSDRRAGISTEQRLEPNLDGKTNCLTSVAKDNLIIQRSRGKNSGGIHTDKVPCISSCAWEQNNLVVSGTFRTHTDDYGFREIKSGKGATIPARGREDGSGQNVVLVNGLIRRLTPTECARLQTIPEWYIWRCSDTQIYRMLGNGWTVEVIKHILQYLKP